MRILLLLFIMLGTGCSTLGIKCEDTLTPASCELAKEQKRAESRERQLANSIPICTVQGKDKICTYVSREEVVRFMRSLGGSRNGNTRIH